MSIQPIPQDVVAQIKSSITITSLNGVIVELFKNSLDAGSTKVELTVDYSRGSCVVEDDGLGIAPDEFSVSGGLGKLYHTSKWNSPTPVHGGRGIFLAALSAMALVTITSHHHQHRSHNTLSLHKSDIISRQIPAPQQQHLASFSHGTRLTVNDLFGNMPVRVKQRAIILEKQRGTFKEWEELKHDIVNLLLAWTCNVAVTIRESGANQKTVIHSPSVSAEPETVVIPRVCSILSQSFYIAREEKSTWISVGASTPNLRICGCISLEPCATKTVQFVSFGIQPLAQIDGQSVLHNEINRLFMNSAFGNVEDVEDLEYAERDRHTRDGRYKSDGYTSKELKVNRKGVDRWPKFFINIDLRSSGRPKKGTLIDIEEVISGQRNELSVIIELLQTMIWEFLTKHHFHPRNVHRGRSKSRVLNHVESFPIPTNELPLPKTRSLSSGNRTPAKSILKRSHSSLDLLGTNVKFPSFRRVKSKPDYPFDSWTRIKNGNPNKSRISDDDAGSEFMEISQIQRSATTPPSGIINQCEPIARTLTPNITEPTRMPISKDGKIIRRPFEDVGYQTAKSAVSKPGAVARVKTPKSDNHIDQDLVAWINPITKVRSVVDTRTGLTVPSNRFSHNVSIRPTRPVSCQSMAERISNDNNGPSPWISDLLKHWNNPVFMPAEQSIPLVSFEAVIGSSQNAVHGRKHHCSGVNMERGVKHFVAGITGHISKEALMKSEVIAQVDKKFILVKVPASKERRAHEPLYADHKSILIIDQHAADERIRIEILLEELCSPVTDNILARSFVKTQALDKHLVFKIPFNDFQLVTKYKQHFANWGILYDTPNFLLQPGTNFEVAIDQQLIVRSLPPGIIERCKLDTRLLIDLIRVEAWKIHEKGEMPSPKTGTWLDRIQDCPQGLIDMLNSRACRSAIMFNDELTIKQCEALILRLADCKLPFQCAHGRPSLVPLVEFETFAESVENTANVSFGTAFRKWKDH